MTAPQLDADQEPILWCNRAEPTRTRDAFVWNDAGQRVRSFDDKTGLPRVERIPQQPHRGTPLFGLVQLHVRNSVKVLCDDGNERQIKITNAAAHINDTDDSYERYQLGTKGRKLGWIADGSCPAAMVMMGHIVPSTVKSKAAHGSAESPPCNAQQAGWGKPPCVHYKAELAERQRIRVEDEIRRDEATKSEESRLMKENFANTKKSTDAMADLSEKLVGVVAQLAANATKPAPVLPEGKVK